MSEEPPAPDAGSPSDGEQPQIVVDDPEDFAKTRQLRAIFDARDDYFDARKEANKKHQNGDFDFPRKNSHIFSHMQHFAMALEPLLITYEEGKEIWEEREYGVKSNFVEQGQLASDNDAFQLLRAVIDQQIDNSVTEAKLRRILSTVGIEMQSRKIEDIVKQFAPDSSNRQRISVDTPATMSPDAISQTDMERLQQQLAAMNKESEPSSVDPAQLANAIYKKKRGKRHRLAGDQKFEHRLRIAATDWGWSIKGVKQLVTGTPKLAYSKGSIDEFGTTAPPQNVSDAVVRDLQSFVNDIGLGLSFDEEQQTKIDNDLLKEVNDWRDENI